MPALPKELLRQSGMGRYVDAYADAYPVTPDDDTRAFKQAERSRQELLGADPEWWTGE